VKIKGYILTNVRIVFLGTLLLGFVIIAKVLFLQYGKGKKWKQEAEQTNVSLRPIKSTRGNIYSDNGGLLATSLPSYRLAFDPMVSQMTRGRRENLKEKIDSLDLLLCGYFKDRPIGGYKKHILSAIKSKKKFLRINRSWVNYHDKKIMETWPIFRKGQMRGGIIFEKEEKRFKPFSPLALRTVGKYNSELEKGISGVEFSFDSLLAGVDGSALFVKIGRGRWKPLHDENEKNPRNGYDVVTTIDVNLQDVAENTLMDALVKHDAQNGSVILMEVKTGKIKALANLGRKGETSTYIEDYNYAVAKKAEPGSTFKLASMMAVFEKNPNLKLTDSIDCEHGKKKFFDRFMYDSHPLDKISIQDVFAQSSNIGVAKLAMNHFYTSKKEQEEFSDYFSQFGLRQNLEFQLKGSVKSNIKSPDSESWSGVSIPWMAHGYELEMSPLQVLAFYNTVANDGKFVQPILVDEVRDANESVVTYKAKVFRKKICSDATIKKVKTMLNAVVEYGTASNIRTDRYKIAGKTGTAKKIMNGKYVSRYYVSFVGYFPADNPKYSCIVTIDDPRQGGYYGNSVAAPVFRKIADNIYNSDLGLHEVLTSKFDSEKGIFPVVQAGYQPDLDLVCHYLNLNMWDTEQLEWVRAKRDDELKAIKWKDLKVSSGLIPDVKGMVLRDALPLLENLGLRVIVKGRGRIVGQSLLPQTKLIVGSRIELKLSE